MVWLFLEEHTWVFILIHKWPVVKANFIIINIDKYCFEINNIDRGILWV
mgnify:CR=1 FL=1